MVAFVVVVVFDIIVVVVTFFFVVAEVGFDCFVSLYITVDIVYFVFVVAFSIVVVVVAFLFCWSRSFIWLFCFFRRYYCYGCFCRCCCFWHCCSRWCFLCLWSWGWIWLFSFDVTVAVVAFDFIFFVDGVEAGFDVFVSFPVTLVIALVVVAVGVQLLLRCSCYSLCPWSQLSLMLFGWLWYILFCCLCGWNGRCLLLLGGGFTVAYVPSFAVGCYSCYVRCSR